MQLTVKVFFYYYFIHRLSQRCANCTFIILIIIVIKKCIVMFSYTVEAFQFLFLNHPQKANGHYYLIKHLL